MIALQLVPVVLSLIVLGAHFFRAGNLFMIFAVLCLLGLLAVRRVWAARIVQVALVLGAIEWVRTLVSLAGQRSRAGEPVVRLILILGSVALVTGLAALMFSAGPLREKYRQWTPVRGPTNDS